MNNTLSTVVQSHKKLSTRKFFSQRFTTQNFLVYGHRMVEDATRRKCHHTHLVLHTWSKNIVEDSGAKLPDNLLSPRGEILPFTENLRAREDRAKVITQRTSCLGVGCGMTLLVKGSGELSVSSDASSAYHRQTEQARMRGNTHSTL